MTSEQSGSVKCAYCGHFNIHVVVLAPATVPKTCASNCPECQRELEKADA
jgi:endogenous inhibitor of DNA gyrase (YacG/DUF329 family)